MYGKWIAYPGEFEVYHHARISLLRKERNSACPPIWKMDGWYPTIRFYREFSLEKPCAVTIKAQGAPYVQLDGLAMADPHGPLTLPAGRHVLDIRVGCMEAPPALLLQGAAMGTDRAWTVFFEGGEGKAAAELPLVSPDILPSQWRLPTVPWPAVEVRPLPQGILVDFGREAMGKLAFTPRASGKLTLYYGESEKEALDTKGCEVYESVEVTADRPVVMAVARALRWVYCTPLPLEDIYLEYEVLPQVRRGGFRCSDEKVNAIMEVAYHTMELNTREFFLDGIKRDRWVWAGDALQSILINHYTFFDRETTRRTLRALRGKDPFRQHINTIMDYTFYWFMSVWEDYWYTGDASFIEEIYPKMVTAMEFCLNRRNKDGFLEGQKDDWVFVDWADGLPKDGELCFEQLLFSRALEVLARAGRIAGDGNAPRYEKLAEDTRQKMLSVFWAKEKKALLHYRKDGRVQELITKYPTMFALQMNLFDEPTALAVGRRVLLGEDVPAITTPYMRFYELDALARIGLMGDVMDQMRDYWGGMLAAGATSFWEMYAPGETDHLAMYGRPYGRSLCHCWGAGPLYLAGRHLLGVYPTAPGYDEYRVEPQLAGLDWLEGTVPTPTGEIAVSMTPDSVTVTGCGGQGTLIVTSGRRPARSCDLGHHRYSLDILPHATMTVPLVPV